VVTPALPGGLVAEAAQASVATGRNLTPIYVGAGLLLLALVFLAVRPSEDDPVVPTVTSVRMEASEPVAADGPARALEDAKEMAARGNVVLAHRKLEEIPADSPLRQSPDFQAIEGQWADEIFKVASDSPDLEERRSLLDKVASTPEVDSERRLRAADELSRLSQAEELEAVDVADLPRADSRPRPRAKRPRTTARVARAARPSAASRSDSSENDDGEEGTASPAAAASAPSEASAPRPVVAAKSAAAKAPAARASAPTPPAAKAPATGSSTSGPVAESRPAPKPKTKPAPRADTDLIRDSPF
jgi:hypothetical protein